MVSRLESLKKCETVKFSRKEKELTNLSAEDFVKRKGGKSNGSFVMLKETTTI